MKDMKIEDIIKQFVRWQIRMQKGGAEIHIAMNFKPHLPPMFTTPALVKRRPRSKGDIR